MSRDPDRIDQETWATPDACSVVQMSIDEHEEFLPIDAEGFAAAFDEWRRRRGIQ